MKTVVAMVALVAVVGSATDPFRHWAATQGKTYTAAQWVYRGHVFAQNMKRAEQLNKESQDTVFGPSKFADLTPEEFKAQVLGTRPVFAYPENRITHKLKDLPANFDWREKTDPVIVGKVKDQLVCGSCWAFSTVAYLEGQYAKEHNDHQEISEQQLVDCDHECREDDPTSCDQGCNGGWMDTAMTYAIKSGMMHHADYKYKTMTGKCKYNESLVFANFSGKSVILPVGDEVALQNAVYTEGPISVAVHADPWQLYFGGIFDHSSCSSDPAKLDHGVAAVGWGHDEASGKDYWIIRNSWGWYWGESGYIRLRMGSNMCGVANSATMIKK